MRRLFTTEWGIEVQQWEPAERMRVDRYEGMLSAVYDPLLNRLRVEDADGTVLALYDWQQVYHVRVARHPCG